MDEHQGVDQAATPVVETGAKLLNENKNLNSGDSAQKPESAGKLTLTDLWKKAKTKEVAVRPAGDVEVVVLDDQAIEDGLAEAGVVGATVQQQPADMEVEKEGDNEVGKEAGPETGPASTVDGAAGVSEVPASPKPAVQAKKVIKAKRGRSKKGSSKKVELVNVGSLHVQKGWFNSGYIFPVGFKSCTQFRSSVDISDHCMYECEVIGESGQFWPKPTFRVMGSDRPDDPLIGKTPTACWTAVQKRINQEIERRRVAGEDLPPAPKTAIPGTEYFGFNHERVVAAIEALDVEKKAAEYWAARAEEEVETHAVGVKVEMAAANRPAMSSDDSAVTEDADDVPLEKDCHVDSDECLAKTIVDGMVDVIEMTEANAKKCAEMDDGGDVQMEDAITAPGVAQRAKQTNATKKRRSFSFDPSTIDDMEALYAKSSLPSKDDKVRLAEKHGIEVKQVESWMGKRRKADKDAANGIVKVKKLSLPKKDGGCADPVVLSVTPGVVSQATVAAAPTIQPATQPKPQKAPRVPLSDEELQAKVGLTREQLDAEATALRERGLLAPLVDLESLSGTEPTDYSDNRLCFLAVGQRITLSELVSRIWPTFEGASRPSEDTMRASLALILERKSADPVNKSVKALDRVDWKNADDLVGDGLWQWEAKNKEHLDKAAGASAVAIKRRAAKVNERLKAIVNLLSLCDLDSPEKKEKAVEAFTKAVSLATLEEEAEVERKREKLREDTERLKAEKKREKELLKAEKLKAKEEKEAEKEQMKAEKERKRMVEKAGFKDPDALKKSASIFKSFFGAKATTTSQANENADEAVNADKKTVGTYYERRFLKPTGASLRPAPVEISLDGELASGRDHGELVAEFRASMKAAHGKYVAEEADLKKRCLGLPPSWARKADAIEVAERNMHQLTSNGLSPESIQTYRRKFIYVKDVYTVRPPFYGSRKPLETDAVGPRRILGKDPNLDYDIMSDEDWEEEPEGSSLSKDDVMSEEDDGDEDDNSFCVGDGYLSADEGIRSDDDGVIPMDDADMCIISKGSKSGRPDLSPYLEKSRRSGKPFVFVRGSQSVEVEANHGACYRGDAALCASLEMEILLPGARLEVPDLDEEKLLRQTGEKSANKDKEKVKADLEGLLPDLTAYILANATATKPSLIDGFVDRHKEHKLTKKWVGDSISALASRSGKMWKLKPATDTHGLPDGGVTPMCTIRAPTTVKGPCL